MCLATTGLSLFTVVTFTSLFNLTRHPTITVPAGVTEGGLPVRLLLAGNYFGDPELLHRHIDYFYWFYKVTSPAPAELRINDVDNEDASLPATRRLGATPPLAESRA